MDKKLIRIIISSIILLITIIINIKIWWVNLILCLISYLIVAYKIIFKSAKNIVRGKIFDENLLMLVASVGAFVIGEYTEGVLVILLYSIGEYLQAKAVKKSRNAIASLMKIKPEKANLKIGDKIEEVEPSVVEIGSTLIVKSGEKVPIDCVVIKGESYLDLSSLTGESLPKNVYEGDEILSGSINLGGVIEVKTIKKFEDSAISRILGLIENSNDKKSKTENFITKFAKYYTPAVFALAIIVAFFPPIFLGFSKTFSTWLYRALVFLVVSCPCALVISIPLSFFGGIGSASKKGILVKGSDYIEKLAKIDKVVFDKTGTLTKGTFKVKKVVSLCDLTENEILEISNILETFSNHPISNAFDKNIEFDKNEIEEFKEISGYGIASKFKGIQYYLGSLKLLQKFNINIDKKVKDELNTIIYLADEKEILGVIFIGDEIKDFAKESIDDLKNIGIKDVVMLTGDNENIANSISENLGITKVYANQLPADKLENLEREMVGCKSVAYVGDGINDTPVLVRSDVGISMGGIGSDSAIEISDVVITNDDLKKLPEAIKISKKTLLIAKENIYFSLGIKLLSIILASFGIVNMWMAIFADVGVTLLAILNSLRLLKFK